MSVNLEPVVATLASDLRKTKASHGLAVAIVAELQKTDYETLEIAEVQDVFSDLIQRVATMRFGKDAGRGAGRQ